MGLLSSILGVLGGPAGGAIAQIGSSLVGGLLNRRKNGQAAGTDFVKLRNDALAAGFNPLTALNATGAAGYQRDFNPSLSSGAFIAEAIGRGAETYFNSVPRNDAQAAGIKLLDAFQTARREAAAHDPLRRFGYALTQTQPFGSVLAVHGVPNDTSTVVASGNGALAGSGNSSHLSFGGSYLTDPTISDGQDWENRYSDIGGNIAGVAALGADMGLNVGAMLDSRAGAQARTEAFLRRSALRDFQVRRMPQLVGPSRGYPRKGRIIGEHGVTSLNDRLAPSVNPWQQLWGRIPALYAPGFGGGF